jgi:hypothetical protein
MKFLLTLILSLLWAPQCFSQTSVGLDNSPFLTKAEASLLDSLLLKNRENFSFTNKKVAFISGHSATDIKFKGQFFQEQILPELSRGQKPIIIYKLLNEKEKSSSGGYDLIIMQTPKLITKKQMALNLKRLKENKN